MKDAERRRASALTWRKKPLGRIAQSEKTRQGREEMRNETRSRSSLAEVPRAARNSPGSGDHRLFAAENTLGRGSEGRPWNVPRFGRQSRSTFCASAGRIENVFRRESGGEGRGNRLSNQQAPAQHSVSSMAMPINAPGTISATQIAPNGWGGFAQHSTPIREFLLTERPPVIRIEA